VTIEQIQKEIIEEFSLFGDWMEKYEYIIELGKSLPLIDPSLQDEDHLIRGCQSRVWLNAEEKDGIVLYTADSEAVITKGIIALLVRVLNQQPASEIAQAELHFIDEVGLKDHLSPTRSNGLVSMIKQMKYYAIGLQGQTQPK
jgi:cysteine desulfuration protein SufE